LETGSGVTPVPQVAAERMTIEVNHVNGDDLHLIHGSKLERD
jgi:hypothetical protein